MIGSDRGGAAEWRVDLVNDTHDRNSDAKRAMFFYLAGAEVKPDDGFSMTMQYNRAFILELWFPMLVFDIIAIVFLSLDYGICPGDPLWVWGVFALVFQVFFFYILALCATIDYSYEKFRLHANIVAAAITGVIAISGAVIILSPSVSCAGLLYSGLWIWAIFAFTIVTIAFAYYAIASYFEYEEVLAGRRKRPEMDYLLHSVIDEQPNADLEESYASRYDRTRQPIACQRRGCQKLGTYLCAACKQASYCSSECLFLDFKAEHKYHCSRMLAESLPPETRRQESGLLGQVRHSSFVPSDPPVFEKKA